MKNLWRSALSVKVAEEVDSGSWYALLDELALTLVLPECSHEWSLGVGAVVLAHDLANGDRGLTSVVKGNSRDKVVADVSADDIVEEMGVDETEVSIDGGSSSTSEGPGAVLVVGKGGIGVLEECDGNWK